MKILLVILLCYALAGCVIGNGRICGPQTPLAYCDKKAYQALLHPIPHRDLWRKNNVSTEDIRVDWIKCGGQENGWQWITPKPDETYLLRQNKLRLSIEFCMMGEGYKYGGNCEVGYAATFPKCLISKNQFFSRKYWAKINTAMAETNKNWLLCGGNDDGQFYLKTPASGSALENEAAFDQKYYVNQTGAMLSCMLDKGYRYAGECDNAMVRNTPVCNRP
jgi:hypothetical protein